MADTYRALGPAYFGEAIGDYRRALDAANPMPMHPHVEAELDRDWIGNRIMCCKVLRSQPVR